jgi:hypothetical protein
VIPDDGGEYNPYAAQTRENTSTGWLNDQTKVDIDLDGMGEYAKNMVTIQKNLMGHLGHLNPLMELPHRAWVGSVLPEGAYTMKLMIGNYQELLQYCAYLATALGNIGNAAQTVADIFSRTDGWSAASLDAIKFAYGDRNVPKPGNLPPWVTGKTWFDQYFENLQKGEGVAGSPDVWRNLGSHTNPDGSTTMTSVNQNGVTRTMTVFSVPGGGPTITTITTTGLDGKVLSKQSQQSTTYLDGNSVVETTTSYDGAGTTTGAKTETTTYGSGGPPSVLTENFDASGNKTSSTFDGTTSNGEQEVRTTVYDDKGQPTVTQDVHAGSPTPGTDGMPDSPAADAVQDVTRAN